MKLISMFALSALVVACSSSADTTPAGAGAAKTGAKQTALKPKTKTAPAALSKTAGKKPPAGATSVRGKAGPSAGGATLPVPASAEVFAFPLDYNGDGADESMLWAVADGTTLLWTEGRVECADGLSDGTGGFVAAIQSDGSGAYMFVLDQCPEQNSFGCAFDEDGTESSCGACVWDDAAIVCGTAP